MTNRLRWLGHSGWQIITSQDKVFLIDPWLTGNPVAPVKLEELPPDDFALFTHDHEDHIGDAVAIGAHTGAVLVGQPETTNAFQEKGAKRVLAMNIGGSLDLDGVNVTMTDACHTSATGSPAGYILTFEDRKVLYHAGDTGLHANMAIWGELFDIDVALLPIGDRFTMDARQAAKALKLLRAKAASPMHYKTFPPLAQDATQFARFAEREAPSARVYVMEPGEELPF